MELQKPLSKGFRDKALSMGELEELLKKIEELEGQKMGQKRESVDRRPKADRDKAHGLEQVE